ncbi:sugar ABC transporter ATP-binding protein [Azospirillum sp. TSH100]|uniref:ABC transporter ATP-binding protein n=1 Tax=Azospirillum sp. TSH100 TaxID=652764 RepID=UPI000D617A5B|nr:sn-glycerol-3-phosphate ABC transporter ATP-binding protein UgpC [Azospirillum sp. TSH100]PWC84636.1 sugar ABC transporter ATP-binding protein [Azospirillum sp. TSH100]QCG91016.1 sn-glycerol-3-phosphate ABC transporter ATP-binding protein UgpC [Azospirillum sp. TSH100]
MAGLELRGIRKDYGATAVLKGIDLSIADGEFVVFVGPSGCGKSTLLRVIAGLETVTAGDIRIDGAEVTRTAASDRGLAMVFQSYALYPHMTVHQNMSFALENMGIAKAEISSRVDRAARMLRLTDYLQRKPAALSGGQRQRVAIGRAIVRDPKIFLFDEPLSNLDAELRVATRKELAALHAEIGGTMIYVTHDQVEAMTLADRIVVLNGGRIEQIGTPLDLYNCPANLFVAGFIGSPRMNLLPTELVRGENAGPAATLGIRPEHVEPCAEADADLTVRVDLVEQLGGETFLYTSADTGSPNGIPLTIRCDGQSRLARGDLLPVRLRRDHLHRFDAAGLACRPEPLPARSHS